MNVTNATFLLALVTLGLVLATVRQLRISGRALQLSIRPLLGDPQPLDPADTETIQFGAPGRNSVEIAVGDFYCHAANDIFQLSVAFRNIGAGVAAIQSATTDPQIPGDVLVSRKFVPVGEHVRANISILTATETGTRFADQFWALDGFTVSINYSDTQGTQALTSRAHIKQTATHTPWIAEISIHKAGKSKALVIGRSSV